MKPSATPHRRESAAPQPFRKAGFTLVEIMIVVLVVAILCGLAMVVIGRIQNRAARSLIQNNLRQLYQAKEYYYLESGDSQTSSIPGLAAKGYLRGSVKDQLMNAHSFEAHKGWHYYPVLQPGQPVAAYQGTKPADGPPTGEVIYYPGKPSSAGDVFGGGPIAAPGQVPPQPQSPALPTPPAGSKPGTSPTAPWVPVAAVKLPSLREDSPRTFTQVELLKLIGAGTPNPGDPPRVTGVTVNPRTGTVTGNPDGSWTFTPAPDFHGTDVALTVKVANRGGENTADARIDVFPVTDPAQPQIGVSAEQQVMTTGPAGGLGRIQIDRIVTPAPLTALTLEFTVIGKAVPDTGAGTGPVVVNIGSQTNNNLLSLWNPGNMKVGGAGDRATGINLGDGRSHRVTLTWDSGSGNLLVYDNGELKSTIANYHRGEALPDLYAVLGGKMNDPANRGGFNAGEHFDGSIFNTALSTQALTPEQVKAGPLASQSGPANGLVLDVRAVGGQVVDSTGIHRLQPTGLGTATVQVDTALGANPVPGAVLRLNINPAAGIRDTADHVTGVRVGGFPVGTVLSDGQGRTHTVQSAGESLDVSQWNVASMAAQLPASARDNFQIAVVSTTTGPDGATATGTSTSQVRFTNAPRP
jgi:prepilin-type N-terminal cleavage/methylation domain-containing protein